MVVCLGRKSKGRLVGTVLARDKGGIVAAWAPLSLPVSLCFELSAAVRTGKNTSWRLVTQEQGVGLSFLRLEIHGDRSWNRQLSHFNAFDTHVCWFVQGNYGSLPFLRWWKMTFCGILQLSGILLSACISLASQLHKPPVPRECNSHVARNLTFCKPARKWKFPGLLALRFTKTCLSKTPSNCECWHTHASLWASVVSSHPHYRNHLRCECN